MARYRYELIARSSAVLMNSHGCICTSPRETDSFVVTYDCVLINNRTGKTIGTVHCGDINDAIECGENWVQDILYEHH